MLANGRTAARLPAQDLDRARRFYAQKLGLEPVDEREGRGPLYRCAAGEFAVRLTRGSPGSFTQMGWEVDDPIYATVAALKARGVAWIEDV